MVRITSSMFRIGKLVRDIPHSTGRYGAIAKGERAIGVIGTPIATVGDEDAMIRKWGPLCRKLGWMMWRRWRATLCRHLWDVDDCMQAMACAVLRAHRTYSPGHGTKFVTWAVANARFAAHAVLFYHLADKRGDWATTTSLDAPASERSTIGDMVLQQDDDVASTVSARDAVDYLRSSMRVALTPREELILLRRHRGDELRVIAPDLGISHERVRQIQAAAENKLRKFFERRHEEL